MNEGEPRNIEETSLLQNPYRGIGDHYMDGSRIVKVPVKNTIRPIEDTFKVEQTTSQVQKPA